MAITVELFVGMGIFVAVLAMFGAPLRRCYALTLNGLEGACIAQPKRDRHVTVIRAERAQQLRHDDASPGQTRGARALGSKVSPGALELPHPTSTVRPIVPSDADTCVLHAGDLVQARECKSVRGRDFYDPHGAYYMAKVLQDNFDGTFSVTWEGGQTHPGE